MVDPTRLLAAISPNTDGLFDSVVSGIGIVGVNDVGPQKVAFANAGDIFGQKLFRIAPEYQSSLVTVIIIAKVLQTVLFGPLRIDEVERLMGQTWYTVVEFLVAFLIVQEKLSTQLLCTALLYILLKWFHSLASSRVLDNYHDVQNRTQHNNNNNNDQTNNIDNNTANVSSDIDSHTPELTGSGFSDSSDGSDNNPAMPNMPNPGANSEVAPRRFVKLWVVVGLLHLNDIIWLQHYYKELFITANNGILKMSTTIFAVELSIMYASLLATTSQLYFMNSQEGQQRLLNPSRNSNHIYLSLANIFSDVLKLSIYMCFSMVMLSHYCLPLHIFREAYLTLRLAIQKARALIWHKHLLGQYNISSFKPATASDLARHDHDLECIICRDVMTLSTPDEDSQPVKIRCGHIFHYGCLFTWLQRTCRCPTCRSSL
ncbi:hypothetical protein AWJ20_897 [Sugiyamaella lignohabitans]|uniref:RING-type domain-containing protein n=1 Tax=Sugiyamaella lignohabitans TaxID=796027 RepID=A0A161HJ19_9ASCO|nr:uncharacterized protein AWJ20_897 [Sugiyamaella lignohabitans]ANB12637.1 hypothetical protein AWJ20_897 [Sugiyamaella lignohabitans]